MLALVTMFLLAFMVAAAAIWLYRQVFGVHNYDGRTVGRTVVKKRGRNTITVAAQKGFFSIKRKTAKPSRVAKSSRTIKARPKLSAASGKNKVPWGW